jgi:flagellar biosynthetic protein FliP
MRSLRQKKSLVKVIKMKMLNKKLNVLLAIFVPALFVWLGGADDAYAQSFNLDLGMGDKSATARMIQIIVGMTVLSLAPSILLMITAFTRIIIVLSFLRTALGAQQTPPNQVLISLALFLTLFVMMPTFQASYEQGMLPWIDEKITEEEALERSAAPFHKFMIAQVNEHDIELFVTMLPEGKQKIESPEKTPYQVLIPAFMISELKRAFEISFLLFIPFLIIDMLVSSTLMAMGMMMLPPVVISLPFKLIFFVLVDGWYMVAGSLIKSFHPI